MMKVVLELLGMADVKIAKKSIARMQGQNKIFAARTATLTWNAKKYEKSRKT